MTEREPRRQAFPGQFALWGVRARLEPWILTHFGPFWRWAHQTERVGRFVNRVLVDSVVNRSPARPVALSTKADYTSWSSLTDQTHNARTLPPRPAPDEPSPERVAALFAREAEMTPCPKSTVLFAYVAQWFTDGFLRSGRVRPPLQYRDIKLNESNNQVDLGQLYGFDPRVTAALRAGRDGLLKSTGKPGSEFPPLLCGSDGEPLAEFGALPPVIGVNVLGLGQRRLLFAMGSDAANSQIGYAMLNVLFLREHNRIARALAQTHRSWDDEQLFSTARNILTVVLIKLVIEEYINHIQPYHFEFKMEPGSFERSRWMRPNWVAVEFNLLYRWHSLIPSTLTVRGKPLPIGETLVRNDLLTRHGLGPLFEDASKQRAGRICLHNTDSWFSTRTTLASVVQSRTVDLRPYNDYRVGVKLPPKTAFEEISSDPRICDELRGLYATPDDVEFFVGLFAETAQPNAVVPELMGIMVGLHAFSQLMTNPLLAPEVYNEKTFSRLGMEMIRSTESLAQVVNRNVPAGEPEYHVGLTRADWHRV